MASETKGGGGMIRRGYKVQRWLEAQLTAEALVDSLMMAQFTAIQWSKQTGARARVQDRSRDYWEIYEDGMIVRRGTFAETTIVHVLD